jgi:hypothetical protein
MPWRRGDRGIFPQIFNLDTKSRWVVSYKFQELYLRGHSPPVLFGYEALWAPETFWTLWKRDNHCIVYIRCYAMAARQANKQTAVSEQRLGKQVSVETNIHATIDLFLETGCFLCGPFNVVIKNGIGATSSVECWHFSWALQGKLGTDGHPVQL